MSCPPFNLQSVEMATERAIQAGLPILQTHYYAENDAEHVFQLLQWLAPPQGAMVIDAGSGVGEVARIMSSMRPDLAFLLINLSPMQIALSPQEDGEHFYHLLADCQDLSDHVPDEFAQAVMFSSSLCQMDAALALAEAYRVLAPEGVLLINDMVRTDDRMDTMEEVLAARVMQQDELNTLVEQTGFSIDFSLIPHGSDAHFRAMLREAEQETLIDNVFPVIIRATKKAPS